MSRRDAQPMSRDGEIAMLVLVGVAVVLSVAALTGLGAAAALFGGGWVWPAGSDTTGQVLGGLLTGYLVATAARLPRADRLTTSIELGVKNTTIGILLAVTVIGSEEMAVPSAVYGLIMYLSAAALVVYGRRTSSELSRA